MISSTKVTLDKELTRLKEVFTGYNQYPLKLVEKIIKNETRQHKVSQNISETTNMREDCNDKDTITLNLPYAGNKGHNIITKMKKNVYQVLKKGQVDVHIQVVYQAKKLRSNFPVEDQTKMQHMHNVVYHTKCPYKNVSLTTMDKQDVE